jgi:hypothetical protein
LKSETQKANGKLLTYNLVHCNMQVTIASLKNTGFFFDYSEDMEDGEKYEVYTYEVMAGKPMLQVTIEYDKVGVATNMYTELENVKLEGIKDATDLKRVINYIYG